MYVLWDSSCFVITFRIALERSALGGPRRCQILFSHLSFPTFATCANPAQVDKSNGHWQSNFRRCNGYFAAELGAPRRWDFRGAYRHTWGGCHFLGSKPKHFVTFVRLWVWKPHFWPFAERLRSFPKWRNVWQEHISPHFFLIFLSTNTLQIADSRYIQ